MASKMVQFTKSFLISISLGLDAFICQDKIYGDAKQKDWGVDARRPY